jgi:hypothetical protein
MMSRFNLAFYFFPFVAGLLTGCTTLARTYEGIRATMIRDETDEQINNYGAFFEASQSPTLGLGAEWSGQIQDPYSRSTCITSGEPSSIKL